MQRSTSLDSCRLAACWVASILLLALPAAAQVNNPDQQEICPQQPAGTKIKAGSDAWATASGTQADLDIPACFFCEESPAINIPDFSFSGMPLVTNPPGILGPVDTIIERLKDVHIPPGGCGTVPVVVRAMKLVGDNTLSVTCGGVTDQWEVTACTCSSCCAVQPITDLTICDDGLNCGGTICGVADGELKIDICLKFKNLRTGTILGPIQQRVRLGISNMPWCNKNPGDVAEFADAFQVDTDCDLQADFALGCTSNFFPGAVCNGPVCPPPVCHPGGGHQHCVQPPCQ